MKKEIQRLREQLQIAVSKEAYEEAARLRDESAASRWGPRRSEGRVPQGHHQQDLESMDERDGS